MAAPVTVHFATNRDEIVEGENVVGFGTGLNQRSPLWLRYGAADMVAQRSGNAFGVSALRVAPETIPLKEEKGSVAPVFGSSAVFDGLRKRLIENKADLVLLLHGYACDMPTALSNAAELKTKWAPAARPLETAVFAWPSDGVIVPFLSYASDRDDARSSAKAVARALLRLLEYLGGLDRREWCNGSIHLVAHSMGNYVLRNALQALISEKGGRTLPRVFKNIFMMAADEDNDAFEHQDKLARLPELAEAVHVYFAGNDGALTISDVSKGNPDRLGTTGPRTLTSLPQKVTLVDCADVSYTAPDLDVRHQYYRKRQEVIADIRAVIAGTPAERIAGREWVPSRFCYRIRARRR